MLKSSIIALIVVVATAGLNGVSAGTLLTNDEDENNEAIVAIESDTEENSGSERGGSGGRPSYSGSKPAWSKPSWSNPTPSWSNPTPSWNNPSPSWNNPTPWYNPTPFSPVTPSIPSPATPSVPSPATPSIPTQPYSPQVPTPYIPTYNRPSAYRPSKNKNQYPNVMQCAEADANCWCSMGRCNMDGCKYSCSCDGGRCRMNYCEFDCTCGGGGCTGASIRNDVSKLEFSCIIIVLGSGVTGISMML